MVKTIINILFLFFLIISTAVLEFCKKEEIKQVLDKKKMINAWFQIKGDIKKGKVVFAQPPFMYVLYLNTGIKKKIPGIIVEGGPGRTKRGFTPRPFWSKDGRNFIYRYKKKIFFADENGLKQEIFNPKMDIGKETRWSLLWFEKSNWAVGPSKNKNVIIVRIKNNNNVRVIYSGRDVKNWCEVTGNGKYVVYFNGSDVFVTNSFSGKKGIKISKGQSCRPCASTDNKIAWLPGPHVKYIIHNAENGRFLFNLNAPENEEIYRLNWSNHNNFVVHMFGSKGNNKMNIRRVKDGKAVFIGYGWDPDLWVSF